MAGYSKWSKVKHIKGPLDVRRGAQFSKLVKETTVAPCLGGDQSGNLSPVVETARAANMPKDNIERALKKGTGEIEADSQKHTYFPDDTVSIHHEATAAHVLRLYETLEDNDDTQNVYSNFDIPEEVLAWLPA